MARTTRCLAGLGFLIAMLTVAGCPFAPQLIVSPQSLHFDPSSTVESFRIANGGGGSISYTVVEELDWIDVVDSDPPIPGKALLTGTVISDPAFFDVTIDRSVLLPGQDYTGIIEVRTSAGNINVNVSASIAGPASYSISENAFDFGFDQIDDSFSISNTGSSTIQWTATVEEGATWLTIAQDDEYGSTLTDSIGSGGTADVINLRVDRTTLPAGEYSAVINLTTNVSNTQITVDMEVPSFVITPLEVDFGALISTESEGVSVSNRSEDPINLTFVPVNTEGGDWLTIQPATLTVQPGNPRIVLLQVDPTGLDTGMYSRDVVVTDVDTGFTQTISVSMERVGFSLAPTEIDFGLIDVVSQDSIQLTNEGQSPLAWQIEIPPSAGWLSADTTSGTLAAQEVLGVTLFADPTVVEPGSYETTITVTHENGSEDVVVRMAKPRPPALEVSTHLLTFGDSSISQFFGVIHAGDSGNIDWSIDTSSFPTWLNITTDDTSVDITGDVFSGTLMPTATDRSQGMNIRVRRDLVTTSQLAFSHTFTVVGTGAVSTSIDVEVRMSITPQPVINILGATPPNANDTSGAYSINISIEEEDESFIIENSGEAQLEWNISAEEWAEWLTAVTPIRGTLEPNTSIEVNVEIDRTSMSYGSFRQDLLITSNDPLNDEIPLRVDMSVPPVIIINTRGTLNLGTQDSLDYFDIYNDGDEGTILNFRAEANKDWVSIFPDSGQSEGRSGPVKDYQTVSVAVDRSQLEEVSETAIIEVYAYELIDGKETRIEEITPKLLPLTIEASPLSIEVAAPRFRAPSIVRYEMLLRNLRTQIIDINGIAAVNGLRDNFTIKENNQELPVDETMVFVEDGNQLSTNLMILLDYSNSMRDAVSQVEDPNIKNAPDPLQALYEAVLPSFIGALPDHYRVGLAVFNERRTPQILCPVSYENIRPVVEAMDAPVFISDKAAIIARLESINVVDNGASEIYPSIIDGINALYNEEDEMVMFDDTDIRALMVITDGRSTTISSDTNVGLTDVVDLLTETRVRCYPIGWGVDVLANPLIQMANVSGGHYYSTKFIREKDEERNRFVRLPVVSELRRWLSASTLINDANFLLTEFDNLDVDTDDSRTLSFDETIVDDQYTISKVDFSYLDDNGNALLTEDEITSGIQRFQECGQTIANDLQSFITLRYITLNEEPNANVEVNLSFNDPTDDDPDNVCLLDQGEIDDSFAHGPISFEDIAADVRMGQISVRTDGLDSALDTASLLVKAEYVPRNVSSIAFSIAAFDLSDNAINTMQLNIVSEADGGIIGDWVLSQAGTTYTLSAPNSEVLPYGAAGDLFTLDFTNVANDFVVEFGIESPVIDPDDRDSKYFAITDYFEVTSEPKFAPGLPQPELRTDALVVDSCPVTLDLGSDTDILNLYVHNIGATHTPTNTYLQFIYEQEGLDAFFDAAIIASQYQYLLLDPDYEADLTPVSPFEDDLYDWVYSSENPTHVQFPIDRTIAPGSYIAKARFNYWINGGNTGFAGDSFYVVYTVTPPSLVLDHDTLDFEADQNDLALVISMDGQGSMEWSIQAAQLPGWLNLGSPNGSLTYDPNPNQDTENENVDTVNISLDRSGLTAGSYDFDLVVTGTYTDNNGVFHESSEIVEILMTVNP